MDTIIIFGAKYLIALPLLLGGYALARAPHARWGEIAAFGALTAVLAYALALLVGHFYFDPRPFTISGIAPLIAHAADNGFPSDHTLLAAALAAAVNFFDRKTAIAMWLIALLIGAARVAAGVHHAADILGSFALVLIAAWMAHAIMHRLWNKNRQANS